MEIFISTIIPTIGRETLSRAVQSVLDQHFQKGGIEISVVNDSGNALPSMEWQNTSNVQVINSNRRERSVARNTGVAVARGKYLHFLDDDDWLLPGAFEHFWALTHQQPMAMVYGGYRFVDSTGNIIEDCHPDESGNCFIRFMSGEWQPLQASLFDDRIFHSLGGFGSLDTLLGGDEDVDLTRRISLVHDIAGTGELTATIRMDRNQSTTNYSNLQEQSRQSRALILGMPRCFTRLRESAQGRAGKMAYRHGRMAWIYLGSIVWNIQHGIISSSLSRLVYFGVSLIISFTFWLSPQFWRSATGPHHTKGWLVMEK